MWEVAKIWQEYAQGLQTHSKSKYNKSKVFPTVLNSSASRQLPHSIGSEYTTHTLLPMAALTHNTNECCLIHLGSSPRLFYAINCSVLIAQSFLYLNTMAYLWRTKTHYFTVVTPQHADYQANMYSIIRAAETAQWLTALTTLKKDLGSVPSTT